MFRKCITPLLLAALALPAGTAGASWTLLDDFEGYGVGDNIVGQNGWSGQARNVASDPAGMTNQVLRIYDAAASNAQSTYKPITIAEGDTGTLFFRLYVPDSTHDLFIGTSTRTAPSSTAHLADTHRTTAGGSLRAFDPDINGWRTLGSISSETWYNMWHVIDNDSDTWQMFIEGGDYTTQTQLGQGGVYDFPFRDGAGASDLVTLAILKFNATTAYIDDIYLNATAASLLNPLPPLQWAPDVGLGGHGEWNTSDDSWADAGGQKQTWPAAAPFRGAAFGGTAGTVTIPDGGVTADSLQFATGGYTIGDTASGGTLTLAGAAPTVSVAADVRATIAANIAGSDGLRKAGEGELVLSGTNAYTGATTIQNGALQVEGALDGTSNVAVHQGATLAGSGTIAGRITGAGLVNPGSSGSWTILDNFEGYALDDNIVGQNGWKGQARNVASDPVDTNNQVLRIYDAAASNAQSTYKPITIAEGDTGTLFFRLYVPDNTHDLFIGASTHATPLSTGHLADTHRTTAGGSLRAFDPDINGWRTLGSISSETWYDIWHVIDNDSDTWQMYIEGGNYTTQTQLGQGGVYDFPFRYGAGESDLVNLAIMKFNATTAYIDDIYLHATEASLLNPLQSTADSRAGILAVDSVDPSGGLGFAFEFGRFGSPDYTDATASANDVLRLTAFDDPLVAPLTGDNVVDVYFGVNDLEKGDRFRGGMYVDSAVDAEDREVFYQMVKDATYNYYVLGDGAGTNEFGGLNYYTLAEYDSALYTGDDSPLNIVLSIAGEPAAFAFGDPVYGAVMQFTVVPEPGTFLLLACGVLALLTSRRRRR